MTHYRSTTQAEQEEIQHAFQLFDTDGTGRVSVKDVRDALEDGSERSVLLLSQLAVDNDDNNGYLTFKEFTKLLTQRPDDDDVDDMTRMFRLFDKEKKGYIEVTDLKRIAAELGENMTDAELREMIDRAASQRGKVYLEEFTSVMTKQLYTTQ